MFIVDTNVFSEIAKQNPDDNVIDWFHDHNAEVFLTSISVKELYYGLFIMPEGKKKRQALELMDAIVKECAERTLTFEAFTGYLCAKLHAKAREMGRVSSIEDYQIAAICLQHDATLATRNVKDFDYLGIKTVNPFEHQSPVLARLKQQEAERAALTP